MELGLSYQVVGKRIERTHELNEGVCDWDGGDEDRAFFVGRRHVQWI
jgi:hypothetical protein